MKTSPSCTRPSSTTTRIKTRANFLPQAASLIGTRPSSTTTRIKTFEEVRMDSHQQVRDHLPLQQGLRLHSLLCDGCRRHVRDHLPLQQGLRHFLPKLAEEHREAIRIYLGAGKKESALEDFTSLGYTPRDLLQLNRERFLAAYQQTFCPLFQIAQNMGYEVWNV